MVVSVSEEDDSVCNDSEEFSLTEERVPPESAVEEELFPPFPQETAVNAKHNARIITADFLYFINVILSMIIYCINYTTVLNVCQAFIKAYTKS